MTNVLSRPAHDLHNNYSEIVRLANEGNRVIITQDGFEDIVLISTEVHREFEELLYRQYIKDELAKTKEKAKDPNTKWLSEEELWAHFED